MEEQDNFNDIYPCSCGHCTSCGVQAWESMTEQERNDYYDYAYGDYPEDWM